CLHRFNLRRSHIHDRGSVSAKGAQAKGTGNRIRKGFGRASFGALGSGYQPFRIFDRLSHAVLLVRPAIQKWPPTFVLRFPASYDSSSLVPAPPLVSS